MTKFECDFCGQTYVQEKRYVNHMCTKKRRWLDRDEKHVRMGYHYWLEWLKLSHSNKSHDKRKYEDFMQSNLYSSFVKLGRHIIDTRMINEHMFLNYVVKNNIKIDDWCKDSVYERYVREIVKKEDVMTVLDRHALLMEQWGRDNNENWQDFFRKIAPGTAVKWILNGRISPWILLLSPTARSMLTERFSNEQFMIVNRHVDIERWDLKISRHKDKTLVEEAIKAWQI